MNAFVLPITYKLNVDSGVFISGGVVANFYNNAISSYKIGTDKYNLTNNKFNRFQLSPTILIERRFKTKNDSFFAIVFDAQYQVTSFTREKIFKPFLIGVRLQYPIL